jgi:hypothetical protein
MVSVVLVVLVVFLWRVRMGRGSREHEQSQVHPLGAAGMVIKAIYSPYLIPHTSPRVLVPLTLMCCCCCSQGQWRTS